MPDKIHPNPDAVWSVRFPLFSVGTLWNLGLTDLTATEIEECTSVPAPLLAPLRLPSRPMRGRDRSMFGRLDDPNWLLTDSATQRAVLFLVRWARRQDSRPKS